MRIILYFFFQFSGGLFHPNDINQENVFKHAIHDVNANRLILSRSNLSGQVEKVSPQDSFHASKRGYNIPVTVNIILNIYQYSYYNIKKYLLKHHSFLCNSLQYAVYFGLASPQFSAHNLLKYPVTSSPFVTRWKYHI